MPQGILVSAGQGKHLVSAEVVFMSEDQVVLVGGGTRPHVGAVALGVAHESLSGTGRVSCTPSLLTLPTHKEGGIALAWSDRLTRATGRLCVVIVGIHVDDASSLDIDILVQNTSELLEKLLSALAERTASGQTQSA